MQPTYRDIKEHCTGQASGSCRCAEKQDERSPEDWDTLGKNYNALPISQRSAATSLIFMNANQCNPDKQFRFSLRQFLLDYAGIGRDVMIVGRAGQAEIWSADEFAAFEAENLTPEKLLASLEAIGL